MMISKTIIITIMISLMMMRNDKYFVGVVGLNEDDDYDDDFQDDN